MVFARVQRKTLRPGGCEVGTGGLVRLFKKETPSGDAGPDVRMRVRDSNEPFPYRTSLPKTAS
jgi:hypothetical protein